MLPYNLFITLILFSTIAPIIGTMTLLFTIAFEREMDVLKIENNKVRLEKELQHSEYMQMNQQIHPHFLFNSMNLILGLARLQKNEQLIQTIEHLSKYLKFKYQVSQQLIPLKLEIDYSRNYLAIQKIRFGDRLTVTFDIKGSNPDQALIPPYMLQTLVENAFKHGLEKKVGPIILQILFYHSEKESILKVLDNGIGLKEVPFNMTKSEGHGLQNINKRLALLFPNHFRFDIYPGPSDGTVVEVVWPFISEEGEKVEHFDGR